MFCTAVSEALTTRSLIGMPLMPRKTEPRARKCPVFGSAAITRFWPAAYSTAAGVRSMLAEGGS